MKVIIQRKTRNNLIRAFGLIFLCANNVHCFFDIRDVTSDVMTRLPEEFSVAVKDIAEGLPTKSITIVRGNSTNIG